MLKNLENLTNRPTKLQENIFAKLFEQAEIANYSEAEYQEYEQSLKEYRDLFNVIDTAFDEGEAKGKAEGLAEGEKRKALETAHKMRKKGFSIEEICELTGLSWDDVREVSFK